MDTGTAVDYLRQMFLITMTIGGPPLLVGLLVGVLVSIFQALTSISEQTLSFVPKLLAVTLLLMLAAPWMLRMLVDYAVRTFEMLPLIVS